MIYSGEKTVFGHLVHIPAAAAVCFSAYKLHKTLFQLDVSAVSASKVPGRQEYRLVSCKNNEEQQKKFPMQPIYSIYRPIFNDNNPARAKV